MIKFKNNLAQWAFNTIASFTGQLVVVYFMKRTTGKERRMLCVWSEGMAELSSTSKNLLAVWDCEKQAYRNISMNRVKKIVVAGIEYDHASYLQAERDQRAVNEYNNLMQDASALTRDIRVMYGL